MSRLTNEKLSRAFRAAALEHRLETANSDCPPENIASHRICADVLFAIANVYAKAAEK